MLLKLTMHCMHNVEGLTEWKSKRKHQCVDEVVIALNLKKEVTVVDLLSCS